jgi:SNF2 family DNA or RNA helicase
LTRLRQAACHLALLPAQKQGARWMEPSGKLDVCMEKIIESVAGGHRLLVFSQFTSMLKLITEAIEEEGLKYCYLDGSTLDRDSEIRRFRESETIPLFLISLKAGGTGLNLPEADTVIHFDPWWNPAIEEQATARAHRIGQKNVVNSYKLISKGTVEEKIIQLQERKKNLISKTMTGEAAFIQNLTLEELQELLN